MLNALLLKDEHKESARLAVETFARRSRRRRAYRRAVVLSTVSKPISKEAREYNPLQSSEETSWFKRGSWGIFYLSLSIALQLGIVFVLSRTNMGTKDMVRVTGTEEKITVKVIEPQKELEPKIIEPSAVETNPILETEALNSKQDPPKKKKRRVAKLASDPVDIQKTPPNEENKPRRRVVGINFESTVKGGGGPTFAVGNTRMGQTDTVAEDGKKLEKLVSKPIDNTQARALNQKASYVPGSSSSFDKPKRLGTVNLDYPETLKAQGVEGNVVVMIDISESGAVTKVKILKGSGQKEFDESAKRAALKQRFSPAKRDGEPAAYSLRYTYRFRLKLS